MLCHHCWGNQKPCNITAADREEGQWCMDPVSAFKYEKEHGVKLKDANMDYSCKNITKFLILFIYIFTHTRKFVLIIIVYSNRRASYFIFRR